jgi:hypothetical protein
MPPKQLAKKVTKKSAIPGHARPKKTIYQFRVTRYGIKPKVWRRIQVEADSLDDL